MLTIFSLICAIGAYSTAIIISQYNNKEDLPSAIKRVNKFIYSSIRDAIKPDQTEIPYYADIFLVNKLIDELSRYSLLSPKNTKVLCDFYTNNLPCIQLHLITQTENNHDLVCSVMNAVFSQHMAEMGRNNYSVKTIIKKHKASEYIVIVLYATTQTERVAFCNIINSERNHAVNIARAKASPVIDSELEQDLKDV